MITSGRQKIALSTLLDFALAAPGEQIQIIRSAQRQYERVANLSDGPRFSARLYRPLVSRILERERDGESVAELADWIESLHDPKGLRKPSLRAALAGYLAWREKHELSVLTVDVPKATRVHGDFLFVASPDGDVVIDSHPVRVLFYCKDGHPKKKQLTTILSLLATSTARSRPSGIEVAILDVRAGKFHRDSGLPRDIEDAVETLLDAFSLLWRRVARSAEGRRRSA